MKTDDKIIDSHIGQKIRSKRKSLGLTQGDLAVALGLSYQQVQRYESGENSLSFPRLLEMADLLNTPLNYFYQDAPAIKQAEQKIADTLPSRNTDRPLHILLVEDSPSDELLFRKAVSESGVKAEICTLQDPRKVIDFLLHHKSKYRMEKPDLIILDINMPHLNGLELLKQIKDDTKLRGISTLILTNSVRRKDMLDSYAHNANGFIQKNSDLSEFYADIKRTLHYWQQTVVLPSVA